MMRKAQHAFELLKQALRDVRREEGREAPAEEIEMDALFVWSTMHGLAGIMGGRSLCQIDVSDAVIAETPDHVLGRIGAALEGTSNRP
jgi:hypothetical protein